MVDSVTAKGKQCINRWVNHAHLNTITTTLFNSMTEYENKARETNTNLYLSCKHFLSMYKVQLLYV